MKNTNLLLIAILLSICGTTSAQISGPTHVCAGVLNSYTYSSGSQNCFINFSVTGGEFSDGNGSINVYYDGFTPISFSVKFYNFGGGQINFTNCYGNNVTYSVFASSYSIGVSPSSSTISSGSSITLNTTGGANSWNWTCNKSSCGLNSTTSSSVTAQPSSTTVYTVQGSQFFNVNGGNQITCTAKATATVTVNAIPITGNNICCDQAFCASGDPAVLGQQSGTTLAGGTTPRIYQWQSSPNNLAWTNISGATSAAYDPPANPPTYTQTIYYRRIVNPGTSQSISNVSKVEIVPTSFVIKDVANLDTYKATEYVYVYESPAVGAGKTVSIKAGIGIIMQTNPGNTIALSTYGNSTSSLVLSIGQCSNGNMRMEEQGEVEVAEENLFSDEMNESKGLVHPNPISSGNLNFGRTVSNYTLMNSTGAIMQQGANAEKLDVTGLSKGLYMLKLDDKIEKVIVE